MIRKAPDCETVCDMVEALSAYPEEALQRVADFGTKLEVYDEDSGDTYPNYMEALEHPQVVGSFNGAANVLGMEDDNLSPFVLLHEFAHALDLSMGEVSETPEWKGGHQAAWRTNQVVRDYAKVSPSEYFAENTSAFLVDEDSMYELVEEGLREGIAINGMDEREYYRTHQNFSNNRVKNVDPMGYQLVDNMLDSISEMSAPTEQPAMNEAQYTEFLKTLENS